MNCAGCGKPIFKSSKYAGRLKWCSDRCRKRTCYSEPCVKCGAPHGGIANGRGSHCVACGKEISSAKSRLFGDAVRAEVSALWLEGHSSSKIAEVMEWKDARSVNAYIGRLRAKGHRDEFPLRNNVSPAGRLRMSEVAKRTQAARRAAA